MTFLELRQKDVVNCKTGERLGFVADIAFEPQNGHIYCLVVPKAGKWTHCLAKNEIYHIPYQRVIKIGHDIILVDINEKDCLK